jgi:hypothetical protein
MDSFDARHAAKPDVRPGFILSAIAAISLVMVLVLPIGTVIVLQQNNVLTIGNVLKLGWLSLTTLVAMLSPPRPVMMVLVIPSVMILLFSIVFLTAFFSRAGWGPRALSVLAVIWAISVNASTILLPLLSMPGPLPVLTFLGMIPGLIAPLVFAVGFVGFMLHADVTQQWFRTENGSAKP